MLCFSDLIESCYCPLYLSIVASLYCLEMENTKVEFVIHESLIECVDESVVLVLIIPKTNLCHGYAEFFPDKNVASLFQSNESRTENGVIFTLNSNSGI